MIHHCHFHQIPSTQDYIRDHLDDLLSHSPLCLVSADFQTAGIGRKRHSWNHVKNALAFSLTLKRPRGGGTNSLTALEIAVLLVRFFRENYGHSLQVKWPNDLINPSGEKCGGVIIHLQSGGEIIVGIGLNLGPAKFAQEQQYHFLPGVIDHNWELAKNDLKEIPYAIYEFILSHRLDSHEILAEWMKYCVHLNHLVAIRDGVEHWQGIFIGIGQQGEAILGQKGGQVHQVRVFTGSLSYLP